MLGGLIELGRLLHNTKRSHESLRDLQNKKVRAVVRHAYENVPYYRKLLDSAGFSPRHLRSIDDLEKLPASNKSDLRNSHDLLATSMPRDSMFSGTTSGSTGHPFEVYLTQQEIRFRRLIDMRALIGAGVRPLDRIATISARPHRSLGLHQRLLLRADRVLATDPIEQQLARLERLRPTILWAPPSAVFALLKFTNHDLAARCGIRKLVTTAEAVDEKIRRTTEQSQGIRWHNFYGAVETGRIAWQCGQHTGLHLNVDHVLLEIEPLEHSPADLDEHFGSALITTLNQRAMPFLRYRLGDLCAFEDDARCPCGNRFPLIKPPVGRAADVIVLPSGKYVSPRTVTFIIREIRGIRAFQIIQESTQKLTILLEAVGELSADECMRLEKQVVSQLGEPLKVEVRIVHRIERVAEKLVEFVSKVRHQDTASVFSTI